MNYRKKSFYVDSIYSLSQLVMKKICLHIDDIVEEMSNDKIWRITCVYIVSIISFVSNTRERERMIIVDDMYIMMSWSYWTTKKKKRNFLFSYFVYIRPCRSFILNCMVFLHFVFFLYVPYSSSDMTCLNFIESVFILSSYNSFEIHLVDTRSSSSSLSLSLCLIHILISISIQRILVFLNRYKDWS